MTKFLYLINGKTPFVGKVSMLNLLLKYDGLVKYSRQLLIVYTKPKVNYQDLMQSHTF